MAVDVSLSSQPLSLIQTAPYSEKINDEENNALCKRYEEESSARFAEIKANLIRVDNIYDRIDQAELDHQKLMNERDEKKNNELDTLHTPAFSLGLESRTKSEKFGHLWTVIIRGRDAAGTVLNTIAKTFTCWSRSKTLLMLLFGVFAGLVLKFKFSKH